MAKLAPYSIVTVAFPPVPIALLLPQVLVYRQSDEFVLPVRESALLPIIAVSQLRVCFAELSFMLEGVCFAVHHFLVPFFRTVTLCGCHLDVFFPVAKHFLSMFLNYTPEIYFSNLQRELCRYRSFFRVRFLAPHYPALRNQLGRGIFFPGLPFAKNIHNILSTKYQ